MRTLRPRSMQRGFTFVEIMGVLVLMLMLMSILLPAVQQAREAARRAQCTNNLMQIGVAFANYNQLHRVLPPGCVGQPGLREQGKQRPGASWVAMMLPQLGSPGIASRIDFSNPEYSFVQPEEVSKHKAAMKLWAELQTLKAPLESGDGAGETSDSTGPDSTDTDSTEADSISDPSQQGSDEVKLDASEVTSSDLPPDVTAAPADQKDSENSSLTDGERRREIQAELQSLGIFSFENAPAAPVGSILTGLSVLNCPSSGGGLGSNFAGSHNSVAKQLSDDADGLLYLNSSESILAIPDGASSTVLAGEHLTTGLATFGWFVGGGGTLANGGSMMSPAENVGVGAGGPLVADYGNVSDEEQRKLLMTMTTMFGTYGSRHSSDIVNFLMADGAVLPLKRTMEPKVLAQLINRNDGMGF